MANHKFRLADRRTRACCGLIASFALLGCVPQVSNHGYRLDEAALAQVEPGRTSRDEVVRLLGSPSALTTFDGSTPMRYLDAARALEQRRFRSLHGDLRATVDRVTEIIGMEGAFKRGVTPGD